MPYQHPYKINKLQCVLPLLVQELKQMRGHRNKNVLRRKTLCQITSGNVRGKKVSRVLMYLEAGLETFALCIVYFMWLHSLLH